MTDLEDLMSGDCQIDDQSIQPSPELAGCGCEDYCSCLRWHHHPGCRHYRSDQLDPCT